MPNPELPIEEFAQMILGIDDPLRLRELSEVADLVRWTSNHIARMQDSTPHEPPPAVAFRASVRVPDFWRGEVRDEL